MILLIVLLLVLAVGAAPGWRHSRGWGYYPSGTIGLVLIVLIIMMMLGQF